MSRKFQSMSDQIRFELAKRISSGRLRPGTRLVELDVAREFDTSQTPVREAFRALEVMRLVETAPYRGTRVREVSPREMAEAYSVRAALEQLAGELAAPLVKGNVGPLRDAIEKLRQAAEAGDHDGYTRHNLVYHRWIVTAAENSVLLRSWEALEFETRMRVNVAIASPQELVRRVPIHVEIANALDAGDGLTAGRLLREHSQGFGATWTTDGAPSAVGDAGSEEKRPRRRAREKRV